MSALPADLFDFGHCCVSYSHLHKLFSAEQLKLQPFIPHSFFSLSQLNHVSSSRSGYLNASL